MVGALTVNSNDSQLAVVEAAGCQEELNDATIIRLYDVAMTRQEEDDDPVSSNDTRSRSNLTDTCAHARVLKAVF